MIGLPPGAGDHPFAPWNQPDYDKCDHDDLKAELKQHDSGHWSYKEIDCCITGKDADHSPWGHQGIEILDHWDDNHIHCVAHIGKTFAGTDVCLNLTKEEESDDKRISAAIEKYVEQAQEVVNGCAVPGEWSGEDWYLSNEIPFKVKWILDEETGEPDCKAIAVSILEEADKALDDTEKEFVLADSILNLLSGWRTIDEDGNEVRCEAGKPGPQAAWTTTNNEGQDNERP